MTAQLLRVARVMARDPMTGYEMLHDVNACPIDLRDFTWGWYAYQCRRRDRLVLEHRNSVHAVALSPDGTLLATGGGGVDADALCPASVVGMLGSALGQGPLLAASTLYPGRPQQTVVLAEIRLWEVATGKERTFLKGHTHHVWSVAFSPDGKTLASAGGDG